VEVDVSNVEDAGDRRRRDGGRRAWWVGASVSARARLRHGLVRLRGDRGDVPGWVLVTLMTAGLVIGLWTVAGPRLNEIFSSAMDRVVGGL
jgi:hypothetical protein